MPRKFTREETAIKSAFSLNQTWSLLSSLDFWLDHLPPRITQLSLEGKIKAGAKGQVIFNGQTYTFNLIAWEAPHTLSFKVSKETQALFLLQLNLTKVKQTTQVKLFLFDYTRRWYWPFSGVKRWFYTLASNLKKSLDSLELTQAQAPNQAQLTTLDLPQGFYLWRRANRYTRELKRVLKPFNLTPTQWFVLKAISDLNSVDKQLTHEDVAEALKLHPVVISDMVATLVRKNLVRKIKPPNNKRVFYLFPSPIGKQTLTLSQKAVSEFDQEFFNSSEKER